ncbi:hypothetical protein F4553_005905 [Allocatelliglobosispora scoriae]|uniref:Nucleoside 2-deoxyribosyltransferase n=1 Tax=Allocatelliglobosispora scoriae TaxID=643052 RepID=A0A841C0R3_9ACTN|nr:hypothetical protein [Allocatelliglobosispora scoriae]MBB5872471.1 hypothetical protein [Allocatelliglobosispora scoriae]
MREYEVLVDIEVADALHRPAEVLVLKHAQELYGVDLMVARKLGITPQILPAIGNHLLVDGAPVIGARRVLFLGVQPLGLFDYEGIREFAQRALIVSTLATPEVREICLTLHGVGFGLDEAEAFEAELAGLFEAISKGGSPRNLERITFIELDPRRAERLSHLLVRLIPNRKITSGRANSQPASNRQPAVNNPGERASAAKDHAFIAMPFSDAFDDLFHYGMAPAIRSAGLLCERMDKIKFTGDIVVQMKNRIGDARFMVADLSGTNPNVYLEVGYAWGRGVPTILVCDADTKLEFDVRSHKCIRYTSIRDLESKLRAEIDHLL